MEAVTVCFSNEPMAILKVPNEARKTKIEKIKLMSMLNCMSYHHKMGKNKGANSDDEVVVRKSEHN